MIKQTGPTRRPYSRPQTRPRTQQRPRQGDPGENKMRGNSQGNPQQSVEKYLSLARDAASLGDRVSAENYYQYADHYHRLVSATLPSHTISRFGRHDENKEIKPIRSKPESVSALIE